MKECRSNPLIENCPIRNVVARFGDKWSLLVLLVIDARAWFALTSLSV